MLAGNIVPGVQERSGRAERSERAEQCSEHSWACSGHVATVSMLRLNIGSLSMHELSLLEPMLSLSMLILATCPEHAQECSEHCLARSERSAR